MLSVHFLLALLQQTIKKSDYNSFTIIWLYNSLDYKMWKLLEEAQRIQNNIIQAEFEMKKIKLKNDINFSQTNEFMQISGVQVGKQDEQTNQYIQVRLKEKQISFNKEGKWEDLQVRIEEAMGRKMKIEGIKKIMNAYGIESSMKQIQTAQQMPLESEKVLMECENMATNKDNLKEKEKEKKLKPSLRENKVKKNEIPGQGKQNNVRSKKSAYMEIHKRKKDIPARIH